MRDWTKYNEQPMPQLLPLQNKKPTIIKKITKEEFYRNKIDQKHEPNEAQKQNLLKSAMGNNQVILQNTINKNKEQNKVKKSQQLKKKSQISKSLINQIISKISLKAASEQNYPVNSQTIYRLIQGLDDEINISKLQKNKFQNAMTMNNATAHLKKQLGAVQKTLNQLNTIKELYLEKIEHRNKISNLQQKITELKLQNRELKIKISRGIEKIEGHIHNLPCEKEKQLIQEVNKYKIQLWREKEMRMSLENQIKSVVLNFKRFYIEADQARKIVAQQLNDIKEKEKELNSRLQALNNREKGEKISQSLELKSFKNLPVPNNKAENLRQSRVPHHLANTVANQQNQAFNIDQTPNKHAYPQTNLKLTKGTIKDKNDWAPQTTIKQKTNYENINFPNTEDAINKKTQDVLGKKRKFNLEEQIQKMKINQYIFNKINKK